MPLRDYQLEDMQKTGAAKKRGGRKLLGVWPTGGGKGEFIAHITEFLGMKSGEQMLAVVDRKELVRQNAEKIQQRNPSLRVDIERADYRADPSADVIVASAQTLGGSNPERLGRFNADTIKTVLVDETHTAAKSETYARILKYFGCFKPDPEFDKRDTLLIGLTATPNRSDGLGLEALYDEMTFQRALRAPDGSGLMETGLDVNGVLRTWLCGIESHRVNTEVDLAGVEVRAGDWAVKQLEKTVNTRDRNRLIVREYKKRAMGKRFFAFTVDIQHTEDLAREFRDEGLRVYGMDGSTSDSDRRKLFQMFRDKQIDGLISCGVLSVGVDLPMVECLLMCRPTKSELLFTQQCGRGLRPFPAPEFLYDCWKRGVDPGYIKRDCLIIDFVDLSGRHRLNTVPTLFGLKPTFDMKGRNVAEVIKEVEKIKASKPAINLELYDNLDAIRGIAEKIDLFAAPVVPPEIRKFSEFSWSTGVSVGSYQLVLPDKGILSVRQNTIGQYEVYRSINGVRSSLGVAPTLAEALKAADKNVPREALVLLRNNANWRRQPPSEAQIPLLARLYPELRRPFASSDEFKNMVLQTYSRGDVSSMITARDRRIPRK